MKYRNFLSTIKRNDMAFKRDKQGNILVGVRDEVALGFNHAIAEFSFDRKGELTDYVFFGGRHFELSEWLHTILIKANNDMPLIA